MSDWDVDPETATHYGEVVFSTPFSDSDDWNYGYTNDPHGDPRELAPNDAVIVETQFFATEIRNYLED